MKSSTWLVVASMLVGFAVACSSPTAPILAESVGGGKTGGGISAAGPLQVLFSAWPTNRPEPTSVNGETVDIRNASIYAPTATIRQFGFTSAAGWSATLYSMADGTAGVSAVCVDNTSGVLVRCAARLQ